MLNVRRRDDMVDRRQSVANDDHDNSIRRPLMPLLSGLGVSEEERTLVLRVFDAIRTSTVEEQQFRLNQMIGELQSLKRNLIVDDADERDASVQRSSSAALVNSSSIHNSSVGSYTTIRVCLIRNLFIGEQARKQAVETVIVYIMKIFIIWLLFIAVWDDDIIQCWQFNTLQTEDSVSGPGIYVQGGSRNHVRNVIFIVTITHYVFF